MQMSFDLLSKFHYDTHLLAQITFYSCCWLADMKTWTRPDVQLSAKKKKKRRPLTRWRPEKQDFCLFNSPKKHHRFASSLVWRSEKLVKRRQFFNDWKFSGLDMLTTSQTHLHLKESNNYHPLSLFVPLTSRVSRQDIQFQLLFCQGKPRAQRWWQQQNAIKRLKKLLFWVSNQLYSMRVTEETENKHQSLVNWSRVMCNEQYKETVV